jgi:predicted O-methyltransferase YrrM
MANAANYLKGRIPLTSPRYASFVACLELMDQRNAKILVETGTARGGDRGFISDGGSTIIFADWAKDHDAQLTTVDINFRSIFQSKQAVNPINSCVHFVNQDSIWFLRRSNQKIDFLYLDSFDFDPNNPLPSQRHHLTEISVAYPLLTKQSIVMVDDCDLPHGGKGELIIDYLKKQGWGVVFSGYQVILVQS